MVGLWLVVLLLMVLPLPLKEHQLLEREDLYHEEQLELLHLLLEPVVLLGALYLLLVSLQL